MSATVPIPAAGVRYAIEHYGGGSPQTVIWLASAASALLKRKPQWSGSEQFALISNAGSPCSIVGIPSSR